MIIERRTKVHDCLEYFSIILIILDCYSVLYNAGNGLVIKYGALMISFLFISSMTFTVSKLLIPKSVIIFIYFYMFLGFLFFIINDAGAHRKVFMPTYLVWFPFLVFYYSDKNFINRVYEFLIKYSNITYVLAVLSLIFYFGGSLFKIIKPNMTILTNWGFERYYSGYYYLFFETQSLWIQSIDMILPRNSMIFSEAPLAAYCAVIGLFVELYIRKNISFTRVIIYIILLFTITSTTGILCMAILLILRYLKYRYDNKFKINFFVLLTPFIPIVIYYLFQVFAWMIEEKMGSNSGQIRFDDISTGLKAWNDNKLFGTGMGNMQGFSVYRSNLREMVGDYGSGFTSSIFMILGQGGLFLFFLYVLPVLMMFRSIIKKRDFTVLISIIMMTTLLAFTVVPYQLLTVHLLAIAWSYYLHNKMYKKISRIGGKELIHWNTGQAH